MKRVVAAACLALILCLLFAGPATAHTRSLSYSRWDFDDAGATVFFRIALLELTRFEDGFPQPSYFAQHLRVFADGEQVQAMEALRLGDAPQGWVHYTWRLRFDPSADLSIESILLSEVVSSHAHFARIGKGLGLGEGPKPERVLTAKDPVWRLDSHGGARGSSIGAYIALGIGHILAGWDHLAFVFALLLLAGTVREVAVLVTGFTVAHSLTLALAVLGLVKPDTAGVEILIGFSIALVAAENSWVLGEKDAYVPRFIVGGLILGMVLAGLGFGALGALTWVGLVVFTFCHLRLLKDAPNANRLRILITFAFGLIHGFGFAGVLMEMDLSPQRLAPALFGFNVGVELGQLAVVLAIWPVLRYLRTDRRIAYHRLIAELGSAAMCGLGVYWMVVRNFL